MFDLTNMTNINDLLSEFVMMWVLIDPIGTIPVFLAATGGYLAQYRTEIAIRAVVLAGVILIFFIIGGQILLQALGISLPSFQIAGSVVLFLFALTMIFGEPKSEVEIAEAASVEHVRRVAVYPLAIPVDREPGRHARRGAPQRQPAFPAGRAPDERRHHRRRPRSRRWRSCLPPVASTS